MSSSLTTGAVVLILGVATLGGGVAIHTGVFDTVSITDTATDTSDAEETEHQSGITETESSTNESTPSENTLELNHTILIENHVNILTNNSATVETSNNNVEKTYKLDLSHTHVHVRSDSDTEKYANNDYTLINDDGQYSGEAETIEKEEFIKEDTFTAFLRFLTVESYEKTETGGWELNLTGEDIPPTVIPEQHGFHNIDTATVNLRITPDGLISHSNYELHGTVEYRGDETKTVTSEYNAYNIDETSISEPNWVSEAESTIAIIDGVYDAYAGWMLIQHEYLNTVPAGTEIMITDTTTGETYTVETPSDMESGGGMGLSLLADDTWDIAVDEMPEEGVASDTFEYTIRAEHPNGQEYFNKSFSD